MDFRWLNDILSVSANLTVTLVDCAGALVRISEGFRYVFMEPAQFDRRGAVGPGWANMRGFAAADIHE
jgi:hypothetical protein